MESDNLEHIQDNYFNNRIKRKLMNSKSLRVTSKTNEDDIQELMIIYNRTNTLKK